MLYQLYWYLWGEPMIRIKELRKAHGILQGDLADKINVSQATISGWENGKIEPSMDALRQIANLFDVSIDYLLGSPDDATQEIKKTPSYEDVGISTDEAELLADFRKLTDDQKAFVIQAVKAEAIRRAGGRKK